MLVRFLFAAVLLAGCAAPVIMPSVSHPADLQPGCQAGIAWTNPQGQYKPPNLSLADLPPGSGDDFATRDTTWVDLLPRNKWGCIAGVIVLVVIVVASVTFWR